MIYFKENSVEKFKQCIKHSNQDLGFTKGSRKHKHVTTLNCECKQQLDWFPIVIADSEQDRQDLNRGTRLAHQRYNQ